MGLEFGQLVLELVLGVLQVVLLESDALAESVLESLEEFQVLLEGEMDLPELDASAFELQVLADEGHRVGAVLEHLLEAGHLPL